MPWYTNPVATRKVLHKIAKRYNNTAIHDLKSVLDVTAASIWKKQELYFERTGNRIKTEEHDLQVMSIIP